MTYLSHFPRIATWALAAAIAVTAFQTAAFAGDSGTPQVPTHRVTSVETAGLNLARAADREQLDERIRRAAHAVCSPENYRDLRAMADQARCRKAAVASAQPKRDQLVALAEGRVRQASVIEPATGVN